MGVLGHALKEGCVSLETEDAEKKGKVILQRDPEAKM